MKEIFLDLRTNARGNRDYLFRAVTPPGKDRQLLLAIAQKMNQLSENAEWYHSLLTTCNTSIVKVVNKILQEEYHLFGGISCPDIPPRLHLS